MKINSVSVLCTAHEHGLYLPKETSILSDVTGLTWLTFTPLSLLHRFHLLDSELLSQFNELDAPEPFGENVCQLNICADVLGVQLPCLDALSDEVMPHLYMLASIVIDRVHT